jgi:hypothetical protein
MRSIDSASPVRGELMVTGVLLLLPITFFPTIVIPRFGPMVRVVFGIKVVEAPLFTSDIPCGSGEGQSPKVELRKK